MMCARLTHSQRSMIKYLEYFIKYDNTDTVLIGVAVVVDDMPPMTCTIAGSDSALMEAATLADTTSWDEDTICTMYGLVRRVQPARASSPVVDPGNITADSIVTP